MGWHVALTDEANADLQAVVAFLAKKNPAAAERIGLELVDLIFSLHRFPSQGAAVQRRPALRKLAHRHYLIIYQVDAAALIVNILRVWDNRRNPDDLRLS